MERASFWIMKPFLEGKYMSGISYIEAEEFLNNIPKFTSKNPIEETAGFYEFIQAADNGKYREENLGKIIHVAGTNGKGSVCAFMQSICRESGYRTAMFISPHLITTRERFAIDNEIISEEEFIEAFEWLNAKIEQYRKGKDYSPTYFERLFFMGLYIFTKAKPDVTILETGLGGRLDTTNIIKYPAITVITEIGFDHMAYLGDTLEKIAGEKAGIIKSGVPVVFSDRKKEVSVVLEGKSSKLGVKSYPVSKKDYKINEIKKKSIDFSVTNLYDNYVSLIINTTALYQVENAAIAYRTSEVLRNEGGLTKISDKSIEEGIALMHWNGRMEEVRQDIYIDGAHNEDGIEAFAQSVVASADIFKIDKCVVVFSVVKDKQYDKMIRMLCKLDVVTDFIITHIPEQRGANLNEISKLFGKYCKDKTKIHTYENIEDAIIQSIALKGDGGRVYIVGSLYLAGIVEDIFRRQI
jgi:dihydrofolate synthase/folylpolyglutamate synthase